MRLEKIKNAAQRIIVIATIAGLSVVSSESTNNPDTAELVKVAALGALALIASKLLKEYLDDGTLTENELEQVLHEVESVYGIQNTSENLDSPESTQKPKNTA